MLAVLGEPLPPALGPLDRFEVLSRLGRGSHGVVYEAFDRQQGLRVALKTLRSADAGNLLRLKREFRELVSLHHPNLVELGELFEDHGRWFFSMQLVRGVDWTSYIRRFDEDLTITASRSVSAFSCDMARLRSALVQLGHGLHALHQASKLHRDIKPSNIRVQPDGHLVLLDFGLVAPLLDGAAPDAGQAVGTIAYMAPEQAGFGPLTAASDCYAVGILLYEALTGEVPFKGSLLEIVAAKQAQPVVIPAERAASLPADLVALCHELCQIDPAHRPSAAELAARAQGKAAPAVRGSAARPRTRCAGRERELAALSGALQRSRQGELAYVRVYGEPGIGKSSLLSAWSEQLLDAEPDVLLLSGRCHERERVPYKALDAVIDALGERLSRMTSEQCAALVPRHAAALAHVFPVLDRLCAPEYGLATARLPQDPIVLRTQAYGALRELLARLCRETCVVLLLDDLQWSDAESLALLGAVMQGPTPPPLVVVTASWPLARCSVELQESSARLLPPASELELSALPPAAARELVELVVAREGGRLDEPSLERLAADSGNHPLFIELLARAAARGAGGHASLEQALRAEVEAHSPQARAILQLTAVAGAPLGLSSLRRAAQLGADECVKALDELRAAGLLVLHDGSDAPSVAIYHAQIRQGVCAHLDEESARRLHHALAQALAHEPTRDYEALAVHWQRALCPREAALCFVQAAEQADRARAFGHAAALYEQALRAVAGELAPDERRSWLLQQAAALANAGRSLDAAETYLLAAEPAAPAQHAPTGAARGPMFTLEPSAALATGEGARSSTPGVTNEPQRSTADAARRALRSAPEAARAPLRAAMRHFLGAGDTERGLAIAEQLLAEVGERVPRTAAGAITSLIWQRVRIAGPMRDLRERADTPDPRKALACDLLFDISSPLSMLDIARSGVMHTRSLRLAIEMGDAQRLARALAGEALYGNVRSAAAELRGLGIMARAEHLAQRSGDPYLNAWVKLCSASRHVLGGDSRLALADADAALQLFEEQCRDVAWEIGSAYAVSLSALTALGRFDELERRYAAAVDAAQQRGNAPSFVTLVATNRCTVDLVADRPEQCRALLDEVTRAWPADREVQHTCALCGQVLIDLYLGGDAAHRRVESAWPQLRRSLSFWNNRIFVLLTTARGLAALAALAADGCDSARRLRIARSCALRLTRERLRDARASGHFLLAQLATWHGRASEAMAHYAQAAGLWEGVGIYLAWIARQRLGELKGGEEGAASIEQAQAWARSQRIVRPQRFFAMCAPIDGSMLGGVRN